MEDGRSRVYAVVRAYVNFARNNPEYYQLMFGSKLWRYSEQDSVLAAAARKLIDEDVEELQSYQQLGGTRIDLDLHSYVEVFWGTIHGICRLFLDGVYTDSASVERLCSAATDMLWTQLAPDQEGSR